MQSPLGPGDEIVTIGGLYGTVVSIDDETVTLEIAPGCTPGTRARPIARVIRAAAEDEVDDEAAVTARAGRRGRRRATVTAPARHRIDDSAIIAGARRRRRDGSRGSRAGTPPAPTAPHRAMTMHRETRQPWHHHRDRLHPGRQLAVLGADLRRPVRCSCSSGRRERQLHRPPAAQAGPRPGRRHPGDPDGALDRTASRRRSEQLEQARQIIESRVNGSVSPRPRWSSRATATS